MSSKAQGLSLNTIIIATLVLIVLVVLVMILTGYMGRVWTPGLASATDTCQGAGGQIIAKGKSCPQNYILGSGKSYQDFTEEGQQCCLPTCGGYGDCQPAGKCRDWERDTGKRDCESGKTCCRYKALP